jgi:uncharacterized protein (DUF1810 family)
MGLTMSLAERFGLDRFVAAQADCYATVIGELTAGRKRTHWMWFVFPQYDGLGFSSTAKHYAIKSLDEARAYLAHRLLGPRLVECTELVSGLSGRTLHEVFGYPDELKFCSSMTLFEQAAGPDSPFSLALDRCCGGRRDLATLNLLR